MAWHETPGDIVPDRLDVIKQVRWVVSAICRRIPWESKCLVQALTAKKLLNRNKIPCTLYMGVCNDPEGDGMLAHAWLRTGCLIVTGGAGHEAYTVTGVFGDEWDEN